MTVPNLITSVRIILTPVFIIYLINDEIFLALVLFVIAGLSDAADGLIARLTNQKSKLGAFLDPLADKILLVSAFVVLAAKNYVPAWLTVVIISRDVLILLGVLILFLYDQDFTVKPSILSKLTTCLQLSTVFLVLSTNHLFLFYLFWSTGVLTIISALHYMWYWFKIVGEGPNHN